jgi:enoyl-CoA hydratase
VNDYPGFLITRHEATCLVTIDRSEARNALTSAMRRDFGRMFSDFDADDDVAVVVLTGSDPTFTAGVDLKERLAGGVPLPRVRPNPGEVLRSFSKPVICAVNGSCVTGGLEIALSCTFVVASERAAFKDTHARLGLMPGWGLSALLPRAVGPRIAADMTVTGRVVDAAEALRIGLVNTVVVHEELVPTAVALASSIASADSGAVRAAIALYRRGDGATLENALTYESEAADAWRTDSARSLERMGDIIGKGRPSET